MKQKQDVLSAQAGVLGVLMAAPELTGEILAEVQPSDFLTPEYRTVFMAICDLFAEGKPVDAVMVKSRVGSEYAELLLQCIELTVTTAHWKAHAELMREQSRVARLQELAGSLMACRTMDEAQAYMSRANALFADRTDRRVVSVAQGYQDFLRRQQEQKNYITWGFPKLDKRIYADTGDFVIIGGRPSSGKTALAIGMADHISRHKRVGFFSLETSDAKIFDRYFTAKAHLDFERVKQHKLSPIDRELLERQQNDINSRQLDVIQASGMGVQDIQAITLSRRYDVIFVDYIQLVKSFGHNRAEEVARISMGLHVLAQQHGVTVVALAQLTRVDKASKPQAPRMEDLRESGQLEQDADVVMLLYLQSEDERNGPRWLKVEKNKEGECGRFPLAFNGRCQKFTEMDVKRIEDDPFKQQGFDEIAADVPFDPGRVGG